MKYFFYFFIISANYIFAQSDSLISYYPFDGNCNDVIGSNNGQPSNTGISYTTGINGNNNFALNINAIDNGVVNLGNSSDFEFSPTGEFSISIWVKMASASSYRAVIVKAIEYNSWDYGIIVNNGTPYTGKHSQDLYTQTNINDNLWHHLAVTFNNGTFKMYVDGILDLNTVNKTISTSVGDLLVGQKSGVGGNQYDGDVDELKIFDKALEANDITNLYNEVNSVNISLVTKPTILNVYPNPAKNIITIKLNEPLGKLEVYNSLGELLKVITVTRSTTQIDLSAMNTGIYTLKYISGNAIAVEQLIIQK